MKVYCLYFLVFDYILEVLVGIDLRGWKKMKKTSQEEKVVSLIELGLKKKKKKVI